MTRKALKQRMTIALSLKLCCELVDFEKYVIKIHKMPPSMTIDPIVMLVVSLVEGLAPATGSAPPILVWLSNHPLTLTPER